MEQQDRSVPAETENHEPVVIDHNAVPHIYDLVVENAPFSSLRRLRATSSDNRGLVDNLMSQHLELRNKDDEEAVLYCTDGVPYPKSLDPEYLFPEGHAVRVLDIYDVDKIPDNYLAPFHVDTIRDFTGSQYINRQNMSCRTLVLSDAPAATLSVDPSKFEKLVVNLPDFAGFPGGLQHPAALDANPPDWVGEVVLLFQGDVPPAAELEDAATLSELATMINLVRGTRFTLVNSDAWLQPELAKLRVPNPTQALGGILNTMVRFETPEEREALLEQFSFITLDEYRERVGSETLHLESCGAPKKNKGQKLALADFFADTPSGGGSWADEMENLPSAPAPRDESAGPRRGEPGYLDSMPDRGARAFGGGPPQRDDVPLPTVPPFTAFVGNLTFETDEDQVRDFFADLEPTSVRVVKDSEGKAKGFGYVEFKTQQGLKDALDLTGTNLGGRTIRVNVADAPASSSRRDFAPSAADEASQWRRSGPLPARDPPAQHRSFGGAGVSDGPDRDWGAARGAKFAPSRESSGYGHAREPREREEHHHHSVADDVNQWRSSKPLVEAATGGAQRGAREAPPHKPAGLADTESTWSRGTRVSAAPAAVAEPTRKRLNLAPRTDASGTPSPDSTTPPASKASPFGAARPVDTLTREREAEQRAEQRRKEVAEKKEAAKAKEDKARAAREEAQKQERERRPVRVHPSRMPPKEAAAVPDEDGFESVGGRGKAAAAADEAPKPAAAKPAAKAKAGFSFAAAAGALADEAEVDEVTEQVKDVTV